MTETKGNGGNDDKGPYGSPDDKSYYAKVVDSDGTVSSAKILTEEEVNKLLRNKLPHQMPIDANAPKNNTNN